MNICGISGQRSVVRLDTETIFTEYRVDFSCLNAQLECRNMHVHCWNMASVMGRVGYWVECCKNMLVY